MYSRKVATLTAVVACTVMFSCAGSKTPSMASTLWGSLGGTKAVSSLAQKFGKQLAGNSSLSSLLGGQGIEQMQRGLYNTIGDASGYKTEKGTDLLSVMKKQDLDEAQVDAVGESLKSASESEGMRSDQMAMLTGIWEPIAKSLK